jgi:methyltransferase (TIGR00027 family)
MNSNKPSSTAYFVVNGLWWITHHPHLSVKIPLLMGKLNHQMVMQRNSGIFSIRNPFGRWLLKLKTSLMQKISIPGLYLHFVLRKRCIESHVRAALDEGTEQLIVIGSGFDTLSLRISQDYPHLKIIEIDHPATQKWKRNALSRIDFKCSNLHLLPADLTSNTMENILLQSKIYDTSKSSVFVAEGLLMYLNEKEVRNILDGIRCNSAPGSHLIFTYMEELNEGNFQFKNASSMTRYWLKIKREMFKWGLKNKQLVPFLHHSGFKLKTCETHRELRETYLSDNNNNAALAIGENIVVSTTITGN